MTAAVNQGVRTSPGSGGAVIVMGVWCPTCREEVGPLRDGTCPTCDHLVYDEDQLTAKQAIAALLTPRPEGRMTATMSAVACKVCGDPAIDQRGPYAKLCEAHKDEAKQRGRKPAAARSTSGGSLSAAARQLVPLARKLERVRVTLESLPSNEAAKQQFDEAARRAQQSPTPENLARMAEATKQLQTFAPRRTKVENDAAHAERALELAINSLRAQIAS